MKTRTAFVSNSSSSSYIITFAHKAEAESKLREIAQQAYDIFKREYACCNYVCEGTDAEKVFSFLNDCAGTPRGKARRDEGATLRLRCSDEGTAPEEHLCRYALKLVHGVKGVKIAHLNDQMGEDGELFKVTWDGLGNT